MRGELFTLNIIASSNSSTNLTYCLRGNGATIVKSNVTAGEFSVVITQEANFSVTYVVKDSNGNTALLQARINYCYCLNNATCNMSQDNQFASFSGLYINYGACICQPGSEGAFCQTPVDFCQQAPCFINVTCYVNKTADCGPCLPGRVGGGRVCPGMYHRNISFIARFSYLINWLRYCD